MNGRKTRVPAPPSGVALAVGVAVAVGVGVAVGAALTLTPAVAVPPPSAAGRLAVITTGPPADTPVTGKVAAVCPAGMTTEAGTEATARFALPREMLVSAASAALIVTVRVPLLPATIARLGGLSASPGA